MVNALGIVSFTSPNIYVRGIGKYRPAAAFSYVGRYRLVDIPISNMTNSGLQKIQVYTNGDPKVLFDHIGSARHYNINNKHGHVSIIPVRADRYSQDYVSDLEAYYTNLDEIKDDVNEYVIIAPVNWIYKANFADVLQQHIDSKAGISVLIHHENNVRNQSEYLNANIVFRKENDKDALERIETYIGQPEAGNGSKFDISLDTYIMSKDKFIKMVEEGHEYSKLYWMTDMINHLISQDKLSVNLINYDHPVFPILDLATYYRSNMAMLNEFNMTFFNDPNWPIYTRTNDSPPTIYLGEGSASGALISNGCEISGMVKGSILGRGVKVGKGALVDACVVLPGAVIGDGVYLTNVIVDKDAQIIRKKELTGFDDLPIYIDRRGII